MCLTLCMKINGKNTPTVYTEGGSIVTLDQIALPERIEWVRLNDLNEVCDAIATMVVRGAPAIGAVGAFGLAQAISHLKALDWDVIGQNKQQLFETRPTAYDLEHGLEHVMAAIQHRDDLSEVQQRAQSAAQAYVDASAAACKAIGEHGAELIKDGCRILTHCNAGALATVDWGTALAPLRMAHAAGKKIFVYVDETRPRLQGARLTAWELHQEGIEHAIIADNAAGHFMYRGEVDLVITGADRVARNGDIANKIGTYEKAVVAKENGIPFYIAAPFSTIDFNCDSGADIPIEERTAEEVSSVHGVAVASPGSPVRNPAFDVTPAKYITGIITEKGIFKPEDLGSAP